jgi:hypothetical protein
VLLVLASARSLDAEPLLISQLVRVAGQGFAVDALEQTVNRVALPPETLTQLQSAFDRAAEHEAAGTSIDRAFVGERVNEGSIFDMAPEKLREAFAQMATMGPSNEMQQAVNGVSEKMTANLKDQRKFVEDSLDQALAARKDPLPTRLKADELLAGRATEAKSKEYVVASMLLPGLGKVTSKEAGALARLRLAQTAVALERFRAANANRYPDALTELVPKFLAAVPNDPFDGQPLRYQKAGVGGYLLHSVGVDLKDDGGVRKAGADDLSFAVVRPPRP